MITREQMLKCECEDNACVSVNSCRCPFHPNPEHGFPAAESPVVAHTAGNLWFGLDEMGTYRSA